MIKKTRVVNHLLKINWFDLIINLIIKILSRSLDILWAISVCVIQKITPAKPHPEERHSQSLALFQGETFLD